VLSEADTQEKDPALSKEACRKSRYSTNTFPPRDYVQKRGDWVAHAIVSLSTQPNAVRLALEKRGYELKYITKRYCTLPNYWGVFAYSKF